jgi:hypothetical protein
VIIHTHTRSTRDGEADVGLSTSSVPLLERLIDNEHNRAQRIAAKIATASADLAKAQQQLQTASDRVRADCSLHFY